MLTPHEFYTLLLVANAPQDVDCSSPDFDNTRFLVRFMLARLSASRRPAFTDPGGQTGIRCGAGAPRSVAKCAWF